MGPLAWWMRHRWSCAIVAAPGLGAATIPAFDGRVPDPDRRRASSPAVASPLIVPEETRCPTIRTRRARTARRGGESKLSLPLPSAYTILFALIVLTAIGDVDHPGRPVRARPRRARRSPAPTRRSTSNPSAHHRRLARGADQRPVRHRGPDDRQRRRVQQRASCSARSTSRCSSSSSAASSASR